MIDKSSLTKDQYFATIPADRAVKELIARVEQFDQYVETSGRLAMWRQSYYHYNHSVYKGARLNQLGEHGEFTEITVNHFRSILTNILNMTTEQRPSFDARATNTDHKSQAQTIVANGIVEYYNRVGKMERYTKKAVEQTEIYADSYVLQDWDFAAGNDYTPDPQNTGKMLKQGDVTHKNYTPLDVIFDFTAGLLDAKKQWFILRDFENKWDLIEQYPDKKEKILKIGENKDSWKLMRAGATDKLSDDMIPVFRFYHERTPAMPKGRVLKFLGDDCWLTDTELPAFHKKIPIYRLCGSEQDGSGFGYSVAFDLAPIQEAVNGLISTIVTNQKTFGVQNIIAEEGVNINVQDLEGGLKFLTHNSKLKAPEALQLLNTPKEIFEFVGMLIEMMQTISGVNSVARGNPEASLKSGAALALVQAMAVQFNSGLQQSYAQLLEDLGTGLVNILKECATTPRMIEIAGKNNKSYIKQFSKNDIKDVDRVVVDVGNPLTRTTAGRVNIADNLLSAQMVETPQQYLQVLTTGKLEPLIEGKQAELMLIRSENESMGENKTVVAIATDNHLLHIMEHKCVLASPESRMDTNIVTVTMNHIMEHLKLWRESDPAMLAALGQQTPPIAPMAPDGGQILPVSPGQEEAAKVKQPNLPKNPMDGKTATVAGGV